MDGMIWSRGEGAKPFAHTRHQPNSVRNELLMTFASVVLSIAFALGLTALGAGRAVEEFAPFSSGTVAAGDLP